MVCFWYFNFILVFMVFLFGSSVFIVVNGLAWKAFSCFSLDNLNGFTLKVAYFTQKRTIFKYM